MFSVGIYIYILRVKKKYIPLRRQTKGGVKITAYHLYTCKVLAVWMA